jgi:hypothetical protein
MEDDRKYSNIEENLKYFVKPRTSTILPWKTTSNISTWKTTSNISSWKTTSNSFVNGRINQIYFC